MAGLKEATQQWRTGSDEAYLEELVHRVGGKGSKEVLILAVSDPEGVRIGSGGGTLNAILEIDEALRAATSADRKEDDSIVSTNGRQGEGLSRSRVLLVHSGGDSQRSPTQCVCGKAWSALNSCMHTQGQKEGSNGDSNATNGSMCNTPMDLLLDHLSRLFAGSGLAEGSLVVTACDVMLLIPSEVAATADWSMEGTGGVAGLAIAADAAKYAPNHGVYGLDEGRLGGSVDKCGVVGVRTYLQKPSFEVAETSGALLTGPSPNSDEGDSATSAPEVAIDSGVVVFSGEATGALAKLAYSETFKGCTARGVAGGASALRLELYSDLLLALKTGSADEGGIDAYLAGCGPSLPPDHALSKARMETWDALQAFPLGAMLLKGATFVHLGTTPELMEMMTLCLPEFIEPYGLTARAASVVGPACSVEDNPPAVIVNSTLQGAGVVAGGAVVEHCRFEGDGWEVGAGSLVSGVRSLKADHHLKLRSGMCLQQTDLESKSPEDVGQSFVVSLFGARDNIKAHYLMEKASVCGAPWQAFLNFTGASVEDVWGGVPEADRKLWSARLFPVFTRQPEEDSPKPAVDTIMWMQHVQEYASSSSALLPSSPKENAVTDMATQSVTTTGPWVTATKAWLACERLSFKEILARADPSGEFKWRRHLEQGMSVGHPLAKNRSGAGMGVERLRDWDAVAVVAPSMDILRRSRPMVDSWAGPSLAAFCVPPPRPSCSRDSNARGVYLDGPLILNSLLVVAERYSALKRARFGSETDAAAIESMCVLLSIRALEEDGGTVMQSILQAGVPESGRQGGGVWVLQSDGSMFRLGDYSIGPLLTLCQSNPKCQSLTYLGADNAISTDQAPFEGSTGSYESALAFMTAAATAADTTAPQRVGVLPPSPPSKVGRPGAEQPAPDGVEPVRGRDDLAAVTVSLRTLDQILLEEACTPAGAARALATVACRLHDLADELGGGGHRSGPGEHHDWQEAMRGLGTLRHLPNNAGWGPPAALRSSVVALKRLRGTWLRLPGEHQNEGVLSSSLSEQEHHTLVKDHSPDPHLVVRCARHYERAAAVVVSAAVRTASLFVEAPPIKWRGGTNGVVRPPSDLGAALNEVTHDFEDNARVDNEIAEDTLEGREQQQDGPSKLSPQQQGMARHMQAGIAHNRIVQESALQVQQRAEQSRQDWQEQQQQRAIAKLSPAQQGMARHMQVGMNHRQTVERHARQFQHQADEARRQWEQQQQEGQQQQQQQEQQQEQQERVQLSSTQQGMARHMQVGMNHQQTVERHAQQFQHQADEARRQWEQQQHEGQEHEQQQEHHESVQLSSTQQGMARHMQVGMNHRQTVERHAQQFQHQADEARRQWEQQQHEGQEHEQQQEQQESVQLSPAQQGMACHMQVGMNHRQTVERHAQQFQHQADEARRRWEQQQQQKQAIAQLSPAQQGMARHMQVGMNHRQTVERHAQQFQHQADEARRQWEQQRRQEEEHKEEQEEEQERGAALPVGAEVICEAAARIDLAGGWTDTPPISYEAGGAVVNAAVTVSGQRPVRARCERTDSCVVELVCEDQDGKEYSRIICSSLQEFTDFCVPQAPAALLKAALICAGIVTLPNSTETDATVVTNASEESHSGTDSVVKPVLSLEGMATDSLQHQLRRVFRCGGIRITSRSGLPQGSGMGTSSILAGAVLSSACIAAGRAMSSTSLIHAVLRVEQLMTAGGGHQDQVGGLLGGVKICRTAASLPLQVLTETIPLTPAFEETLNEHLVLVFTGKQRLARDLLQGVVRGWHDRLPGTVMTVQGLIANAEEAANACRNDGDLEGLGRCLSKYWEQKKRMAPGAEPPAVKVLLDELRPLCHGVSICGAGGGGFAACITKSPGEQGIREVTDALASLSTRACDETLTTSVHRGRLDPVGMEVSIRLPSP